MADLREQLRPLVDHPPARQLPLSDIEARAGARRRARRRRRAGAFGSGLAALTAVVLFAAQPDPLGVTTVEPAASTSSTSTTSTSTSTTTAAPTTTTTTLVAPAMPVDVHMTVTETSVWETGRCVEVRVDNVSDHEVTWAVGYEPEGEITELWNAQRDGTTFRGAEWNARLAPGAWTTFGLCVTF
ncbi:MAG TPA: cellulose binding domain-containing protein [Acidimicrobiales bacterium]|nr:cellulose binding domain-containing protein [Acidimicrobiales bacterium]